MPTTPTGSGKQHSVPARHVAPKSTGSQYLEPSKRTTPKATMSGGSAYDLGNGVLPAHQESGKRVTPKATSGDKERPVFMEVERKRPIISADRPVHQSIRKPW
jgi:hypothetical protein